MFRSPRKQVSSPRLLPLHPSYFLQRFPLFSRVEKSRVSLPRNYVYSLYRIFVSLIVLKDTFFLRSVFIIDKIVTLLNLLIFLDLLLSLIVLYRYVICC